MVLRWLTALLTYSTCRSFVVTDDPDDFFDDSFLEYESFVVTDNPDDFFDYSFLEYESTIALYDEPIPSPSTVSTTTVSTSTISDNNNNATERPDSPNRGVDPTHKNLLLGADDATKPTPTTQPPDMSTTLDTSQSSTAEFTSAAFRTAFDQFLVLLAEVEAGRQKPLPSLSVWLDETGQPGIELLWKPVEIKTRKSRRPTVRKATEPKEEDKMEQPRSVSVNVTAMLKRRALCIKLLQGDFDAGPN